jgi:hypothetical protein
MNRFRKIKILTSLIVMIAALTFSAAWAQRAPEPAMPPAPALAPTAECPPVTIIERSTIVPAVKTTETPPLASFVPKTSVPRWQPSTGGMITPLPATPRTALPGEKPPLAQFVPKTSVPRWQPSTGGMITPTPTKPRFYTPHYYQPAPYLEPRQHVDPHFYPTQKVYLKSQYLPGPAAPAVAPKQTRIYVNNKLMQRVIPSRGQFYVSLEELLRAGNFYWENSGGVMMITTGRGGRAPISAVPASYSFAGKGFSCHTFMLGGKAFVDARTLSRQVGLAERFTTEANVYDFYAVGMTIPDRLAKAETQDQASSDDKTDETAKSDEKDKATELVKQTFKDNISASLVQPRNNFFVDTSSKSAYPVRGEINYTNNGKVDVQAVSILFKIVDGTGNTVFSQNHSLGNMQSGTSSKKFEYNFMNAGMLTINNNSFKFEITYTAPKQ